MTIKDNKTRILEEVEKHKGELVLDLYEVVMLVGFTEEEDDYYYEYLNDDCETIKSSCVGSFIALKGYLPEEAYAYLCDIFYINVIEPRLEYLKQVKKWVKKKIGRNPTAPIWG